MAGSDGRDFGMSSVMLSGWRFRAVWVSVLLAAGGYLAFALWSGWHEVRFAFAKVGSLGMAAVLGMSLVNYGLRFARWQMYLDSLEHAVPWRKSARIYLAGFALTTTPGKAGEAVRGVLLKQWGVPYTHSFAAMLSERLADLLAIILLTLFGLSLYPQSRCFILIGGIATGTGLFLLTRHSLWIHMLERTRLKSSKITVFLHHLADMIMQTRRCHTPIMLFRATLLSLMAWLAEAIAFYWILRWLGAEVSVPFAVFVYALSLLVGALSFLPGGLGGAETAMVGALVLQGLSLADAAAATVLIRLATLWFAVVLGLLALWGIRKEMKAPS